MCQVPYFVGMAAKDAQKAWNAAGFVPQRLNVTLSNGKSYTIENESPNGSDGTSQNCATFSLTVGP